MKFFSTLPVLRFALALAATVASTHAAAPAAPARGPARGPASATDTSATASKPAAVEVSNVIFDSPISAGNRLPWQEVVVTLRITPTKDNPLYVNRVRVTLTLGADVTVGTKRVDFYRAAAEVVALKVGDNPAVRFYLPPEIVARDSLHGETKYYAVEITAGGVAMTPSRESYSKTMPSVQTFLATAASGAGANDGILLPQFLTPFAVDNQRPSPTFVRAEAMPTK